MTLDEAIEGSEEAVLFLSIRNQPRLVAAVQMGEEAMKQIKESRFDPSSWETKPLLGEL